MRQSSVKNCRNSKTIPIDYQQRRNGNTPAEPVLKRLTVLPILPADWSSTRGSTKLLTILVRDAPMVSDKNSRTLSACTTCTGTSGNGVATGLSGTSSAQTSEKEDAKSNTRCPQGSPQTGQRRARTASSAAAVGAAPPWIVGRQAAAGAIRRTAPAPAAFVYA